MKSNFLFLIITISIVILLSVDQSSGYCCKVSEFLWGHPPDCNIVGCNCDCAKCVDVIDKGCCLAEKTGIGLCSKKRKRSLLEQDLKSFFGDAYEKMLNEEN
uniref:Candidate secreted effector n=1 Tax=Meloidogyne incognita TaxID=6306 RepID=A0A914MLN2_MELIC